MRCTNPEIPIFVKMVEFHMKLTSVVKLEFRSIFELHAQLKTGAQVNLISIELKVLSCPSKNWSPGEPLTANLETVTL